MSNHGELYRKIKTGEFVHPLKATDWNRFFQLIKSKLPNGVDIANPLILGGAGANNYKKNQRLQEHLRIAEEHGFLELALGILSRIPEDKWVMSEGNLDPNEPSYWELEEKHINAIGGEFEIDEIDWGSAEVVSIKINEKFSAEYELEEVDTLNAIGNTFRKNSIHTDVVNTLKEIENSGHTFAYTDLFYSKKHKIRIRIM